MKDVLRVPVGPAVRAGHAIRRIGRRGVVAIIVVLAAVAVYTLRSFVSQIANTPDPCLGKCRV